MFSRTKDSGEAAPQQAQPKRTMRAAPSIISVDLTVVGTLNAGGDIQVDGKVDGDITTGSLTLGEKAVVNGDVFAEEVVIRGKIIGTIRARKVQLCSTCHVEGDIFHQALAVETGAYFEGNCRHSDDPLKEQPTARRAPAASASRMPALSRPDLTHSASTLPSAPQAHAPRLHGTLLGRPPALLGRSSPKAGETLEVQPGGKPK
jgi:cytoskeletal protein CcmA (bactofilin family)